MITTLESLEGWEDFESIAGSRWFGKLVSENGDELVFEPCYQILDEPIGGIVAIPELNPLTKQPTLVLKSHVQADANFFTPMGVDMPCPPRRFKGWSSRSSLLHFPETLQKQLLSAVNGQIRRTVNAAQIQA